MYITYGYMVSGWTTIELQFWISFCRNWWWRLRRMQARLLLSFFITIFCKILLRMKARAINATVCHSFILIHSFIHKLSQNINTYFKLNTYLHTYIAYIHILYECMHYSKSSRALNRCWDTCNPAEKWPALFPRSSPTGPRASASPTKAASSRPTRRSNTFSGWRASVRHTINWMKLIRQLSTCK